MCFHIKWLHLMPSWKLCINYCKYRFIFQISVNGPNHESVGETLLKQGVFIKKWELTSPSLLRAINLKQNNQDTKIDIVLNLKGVSWCSETNKSFVKPTQGLSPWKIRIGKGMLNYHKILVNYLARKRVKSQDGWPCLHDSIPN